MASAKRRLRTLSVRPDNVRLRDEPAYRSNLFVLELTEYDNGPVKRVNVTLDLVDMRVIAEQFHEVIKRREAAIADAKASICGGSQ
jgi:hypothetical protein